jgi:hypothetical protein
MPADQEKKWLNIASSLLNYFEGMMLLSPIHNTFPEPKIYLIFLNFQNECNVAFSKNFQIGKLSKICLQRAYSCFYDQRHHQIRHNLSHINWVKMHTNPGQVIQVDLTTRYHHYQEQVLQLVKTECPRCIPHLYETPQYYPESPKYNPESPKYNPESPKYNPISDNGGLEWLNANFNI